MIGYDETTGKKNICITDGSEKKDFQNFSIYLPEDSL
jgi:hypothetical protein